MAYNANIPQANDQLSQSQSDILNNFQAIKTLIDVNHVDFGSADEGKHLYVQMPTVQVGNVATNAGEIALYTKTGITGDPALFFRGQSNAAVPDGGFTECVATNNGWTRLPSGILLKWKTQSVPAVGNNIVNLPGVGTPQFTSMFGFQVTITGIIGSAGIVYVNGVSLVPNAQSVTVNCSVANMVVSLLVIGI